MKNIWILVAANMRKSKGQAIDMLIIMMITTMFFYIGLEIYFDLGSFYDKRAEELNTAHFATQQNENTKSTARYDFISNFPDVTEVETQSILHGVGGIYINNLFSTTYVIIADGTAEQYMNPPHLVGEYLPLENNAIYIPYSIFLGDYKIGDTFVLEIAGEKMEFIVSGSTEEILFGVTPRLYVSSETFQKLQDRFKEYRFTLISARMENNNSKDLANSYSKEFLNYTGGGALTTSYSQARSTSVANAIVGAMIIIVFSLVVLTVGIIVISFRIRNDIEENMKNIGILKAIGYQNKHIILSIVLQYASIAFIGGGAGILLAQLILPMADRILEPMLGLPWCFEANILFVVISFTMVLFTVMLSSLVLSWKINKIYPIMALRGDKSTRNLKKNRISLEKNNAPLSLLLALKQILQNKKQAIAICIITVGITFIASFGIAVYYLVNSNALLQSVVLDDFEVAAQINDLTKGSDFRERILALPEVDGIYGRDRATLKINDMLILTIVVGDYKDMRISLVEGRFPISNNEILMGGTAMLQMDVNIGDYVTVSMDNTGNNEKLYKIVGTVQTQIDQGLVAILDVDGFHAIQPEFASQTFAIILAQGVDGVSFVNELSEIERDILSDIYYLRPYLNSQLEAMKGMYSSISIVFLFMVVVVIVVVVYMVIKTTILHIKRELVIQKALGFTNIQLMNQISLNLFPSTFFGVVIGTVCGTFAFNPIYVSFLKNYGIVHSNLIVPLTWNITLCIAIISLAYFVSMLISRKIKKISVYEIASN